MKHIKRKLIILWLTVITVAACCVPIKAQSDEFCCFWWPKGRVVDTYGRSVRTTVELWGCKSPKCDEWVSWRAFSNTFGYFSFDMVPAQEYGIVVVSKQGDYSSIIAPWTTGNFIEVIVQ